MKVITKSEDVNHSVKTKDFSSIKIIFLQDKQSITYFSLVKAIL